MATCDASQILANAIAAGYGRLSKRDLVAVCVSSISASTLEGSSQSLGYSKLPEYDTAECTVQALCSSPGTSNTADQILAAAQANKIDQLSRRDLDAVEVSLLCTKTNPPCVTPSAPINPTAKVIGNSTILIIWNQLANTGSLITGYTVKWGTVTGVYTNSANVAAIPKSYTITGLTSGTQYFFVVQATTAIGGCVSVNSNEGNATTTGAPPSNGLLNNLISYWEFDANVNPYPDQKAAHNLTPSLTTIQAGGIINNCVNIGIGGSAAVATGGGDFSMGAGVSFFFSLWVKCLNFADVNLNFIFATLDWNSGPTWGFWFAKPATPPGGLQMSVQDTGGNFVSATTPSVPTSNAWHHVVCGFDSANKQVFIYLDNGARTNASTVTNGVKAVNTDFHVGAPINNPNPAFSGLVDEMGFWKNRVPTASDVNLLFNGGAGLPFSSFTT